MNILLRHTLASIARNPVQSVIIMISTAMITACILVCLCISSMFEYTTSLWANKYYVGSQMVIYAGAEGEWNSDLCITPETDAQNQ